MKKIALLILLSTAICYAADSTSQISVETLVKSTKSWNGNDLPAYPKGQPEVTMLKITVQPGVSLPMHEHTVINAGVLLEGELSVITEKGEKLFLKAGDPIVEVVNKWHYGMNEGAEPAVIIVFYAGTQGQSITIKK